jgi:MoxR-like ATPase
MELELRVMPGNFTAYETKYKTLICGIGTDGKKYFIEFGRGNSRRVIAGWRDGNVIKIVHNCRAIDERTPCWHLAAICDVMGLSPPVTVTVYNTSPQGEVIHRDITPEILGYYGDFNLLRLENPPSEDEPAEPPGKAPELPEEDAWLIRYRLPPLVLAKVLAFRERQKKTLTEEQKKRIPQARYIPSGRELINAVKALVYGPDGSAWEAPLLIGPKGSGKSTLAETLASIMMLPVNKIFGGIDVNAEALLGARTLVPVDGVDLVTEVKLRTAAKNAGIDPEPLIQRLRGGQLQVGFEPGLLLRAVEAGEMLIVDEINMLIPEVTSLLHGLLDWQKTLSVPGYGVVRAPETFRLVGCMNFGYSGTKPLNEAFQDRFRSIQVPHLSAELLGDLIVEQTGSTREVGEKLANLFEHLSERAKNGDLSERILSVRALFRIAREAADEALPLKAIAKSVLTEGLNDSYEIDAVSDIIEVVL